MNNKAGFCAVYFAQGKSYIRWPILNSWQEAGECVLARLTGTAAASTPMDVSFAQATHSSILAQLRRTVADAAKRMDTPTITSHSYALMAHLGHPCFFVDADALAVSLTATQSWIEADQEIDRGARENNNPSAQIQKHGDQLQTAWPIDPLKLCTDPIQLSANGTATQQQPVSGQAHAQVRQAQFPALADRERDTILAALRVYQYYLDHELGDDPELDLMVGMIAGEHAQAMSADEIDGLCRWINH